MRFSKAAMKTRHIHFGHMTAMESTPDPRIEKDSPPSRTYSTERFSTMNNGVPIPKQLKERIEALGEKPQEVSKTFLSGKGFF